MPTTTTMPPSPGLATASSYLPTRSGMPLLCHRRTPVTLRFLGNGLTPGASTSTAPVQDASAPKGLGFSGNDLTPSESTSSSPEVRTITIGIPWTPEEFVTKACSTAHPGNIVSGIPAVLQEVIQRNASESPASLGQFRTAALRRWASRAQELSQEEVDFKSGLPPHCQRVLFQSLVGTVYGASQGFRLSGAIPDSHIFKAKRTTASMSTTELKATSVKMRETHS